jgi:hypothetical protein
MVVGPVHYSPLGPGTLTLGATPTDFSCQVENAALQWNKTTSTEIWTLCGAMIPPLALYAAHLTGRFIQDNMQSAGLAAFCYTNMGKQLAFVFTPNTVDAAKYTGTVIVDPLTFGSTDKYGTPQVADFDWDCVGIPTPTWGVGTLLAEAEAQAPTVAVGK